QRRASSSSDDGKGWQIADVFRYYEKIRAKNEREANERREEVYRQVPEVRRIDGRIQKHSMDISGAMLSGAFNVEERVGAIRKKMEQLQSERAYLMTENNFKIDYMDIVYICPVCKDTGTQDNGEQCSCFSLRLDEMQKNVEGVRKI
ncbi:MAG: hypothetical protein LBT34_00485, partial [Clostridiales Family XIII bacterium]|nr:hypothetical protein [Clostridiales Family XIII bacterium]